MAPGEAYEVLGVSRFARWDEIRAAYWRLARRYHPDGASPDPSRMIEVNAAYECLERGFGSPPGAERLVAAGPGLDHSAPDPKPPAGPDGRPVPPRPEDPGPLLRRVAAARRADSPVIDFGEYAGWRVAEVAEVDPGYLRWLSRHSSGLRFRAAILQVLGPHPDIGRRAALVT